MERNLRFWSIIRSCLIMGNCLGSCLLLVNPLLQAASMAGSNLVISIRAEGSAEVGPSSGWRSDGNNGGNLESLVVPVKVRVRLNPATDCTLSLSLLDNQSNIESLSTPNTDAALMPLSTSAVAVRRYSHSGTYSESIVVTRSQTQSAGPEQLQLLWTLTSSDGAISWTTATSPQLPVR